MDIITSQTGIAISLVVTMLGGVVWLTRMWGATREAMDRLSKLEDRVVDIERDQNAVLDRMARIETKLDLLLERMK